MKIRFAQSHRSDHASVCKVYTFWYAFGESTSEYRVQRRDWKPWFNENCCFHVF